METENNTSTRLISWFENSVLIKLGLVGILTLFLLIPSEGIKDLIRERQSRQDEVIKEISDKWSGSQLVQGPVMVLPYKTLVGQKDDSGNIVYKEKLMNIYILPEDLHITSKANPEVLHRGIFDAVVYDSKIHLNGHFSALEVSKSGINPDLILWNKAKVVIGLSDLKGLKNNPAITLGETKYDVEPDFNSLNLFNNNLVVLPDLSKAKSTGLTFSLDLDLRGSTELNFLHLGKSTNVSVEGKWDNPSFTGRYLPEKRQISSEGFSASWKMPYFNRPYPQQWIEENAKLDVKDGNGSFGVKFILPVDQYQKTMRSAKYAILIILLTFISLFFTELLNKKKVHLLQYILIGAAMTIYYTLLLSFSEQVGFNTAYFIASVATVGLIGSFIYSLLRNIKTAGMFAGILSIFYCFIFVIIQLQDLALIFGSVGLFIIIAILMSLSSRIDWNRKTAD